MIPKLDYSALVSAAKVVDESCNIPTKLIPDWETNKEFLKKVFLK